MSDEKKASDTTSYTLAITFRTLAVAFALTMDTPAVALPFGVLALTFMVTGFQRKNRAGAVDDEPDPEGESEADRP